MFFKPGTPRIALLDAGQNKLLTLFLPPPEKGSPTLEWIEKATYTELIDGSESCRRYGWIPELKLKWTYYNDLDGRGLTIGAADGNLADINSLLALLDNPPGFLKASPGPTAGGFIVQRVTISAIGATTALGIPTGLEITLRGGTVYSSKVLGAF